MYFKRAAVYMHVCKCVHIILKEKERERDYLEKKITIQHYLFQVSNSFVSLILIRFKSLFSKCVRSNSFNKLLPKKIIQNLRERKYSRNNKVQQLIRVILFIHTTNLTSESELRELAFLYIKIL